MHEPYLRPLTLSFAGVLCLAGTPFAAAQQAPIADAPPPVAPFTDFRFERPGTTRRITVDDLPAPFASPSAANPSTIVARPLDALPQAPAGFTVGLYAQGLAQPRVIRTAPNGDVFVAESGAGQIRVFRGVTPAGNPNAPRFSPAPEPALWDRLLSPRTRSTMDLCRGHGRCAALSLPHWRRARRHAAEYVVGLPHGGGHWTRDRRFSLDGKTLFVGVGSARTSTIPTAPAEKNRADILEFDPDGSHSASTPPASATPPASPSIPTPAQLWCSVNERDGLGDNLVPDYITHVHDGGFYGWPWWYMGATRTRATPASTPN